MCPHGAGRGVLRACLGLRRQVDVVQEVGAFLEWRGAVDERDNFVVGLVAHLEGRQRLDGDDAPGAEVDALGLVTEQHRECARDDDEHLLLRMVGMSTPRRVRRIPPESRAGVLEADRCREVRRAPRFLARLRRALLPLEVVATDPPIAHPAIV
jgi:hypothetical protein